MLSKPSLHDLARCAGLRRRTVEGCFDLAVVGAGPAGMTAATGLFVVIAIATALLVTLGRVRLGAAGDGR